MKDKKGLIEKNKDSLDFARKHADWGKNVRRLEEWLRG